MTLAGDCIVAVFKQSIQFQGFGKGSGAKSISLQMFPS